MRRLTLIEGGQSEKERKKERAEALQEKARERLEELYEEWWKILEEENPSYSSRIQR